MSRFSLSFCFFFFFNDTATTEIYTLSLHDALPILSISAKPEGPWSYTGRTSPTRSEEHTSELQSLTNLVCRLLLEKKTKKKILLTTHLVRRHPNQPPTLRHPA